MHCMLPLPEFLLLRARIEYLIQLNSVKRPRKSEANVLTIWLYNTHVKLNFIIYKVYYHIYSNKHLSNKDPLPHFMGKIC